MYQAGPGDGKIPSQNSARFSKVEQKVSALRRAFSLDTVIFCAVQTLERVWYTQSFTVQPTYYYVLSGYDLNIPTMVIN